MITKLAKLERKLSHLDLEDIAQLDVQGSSLQAFRNILLAFLDKYGSAFRIREQLGGDERDLFVLKLIKKLEYLVNALREGESDALQKQGRVAVQGDLLNIARTTLSSKLLKVEKDHFTYLAVDAVLRLQTQRSSNLDNVQLLKNSYLEEGFVLDKSFGIGQSKRIKNAKILVANTRTDSGKIYSWRVRVDSMHKVAEIEKALWISVHRRV